MKKIVFAGIMTFLMLPWNSFSQEMNKEFYQHKIKSYTNMKNIGTGLGIAGLAFTAIGLYTLTDIDNDKTSNYSSSSDDSDDEMFFASLITGIGIDAIIGGIILHSVGKRKMRFYKEKLENFQFTTSINSHYKGIGIVYRF